MLNKIPFKVAINTMLILLLILIAFHLLILSQLIPNNFIWGGRIQNITQGRNYELISVGITIIIITAIAIKGQYIKINIPMKAINIIIWLFVLFFVLNTIGNLFAKTITEAVLFVPLTLISAILCLRIVIEKSKLKA